MAGTLNLDDIQAQLSNMEKSLNASEDTLNRLRSTTLSPLWSAAKIRAAFISFFVEKHGHTFWPSSPVVPVNDPTLLFANAGMNQYKPLFLGTCDPSLSMSKLKRAVNSQKCIRAGGKHNDLEDVGKDVYHHTFFEMLGNWSFGDYFKEEAISWAWECLTTVYGIDKEKLYATYFGGDEKQGLAPDLEARAIWLKFLPENRVLPYGCKENFWEMGATGPCGPCTEIHYDRIGGRDAAAFVNADRPDVIEIWNNVFIQFNREADGSLRELPNKHVDTGMGFERLASIVQGKDSNYDTDIFMPLFQAIHSACGGSVRPYAGLVGKDDVDLIDMAYRVVADHIRTLTFAITDGAVPSSDGRGYVLRRILRRAVRYGQEILGAPAGFFTSLSPVVVANFSDAFPELQAKQDYVRAIIAEEEQSFSRTLDQGVKHFKKVVAGMQSSGTTVVPARDVHILFSSMGFPLDLTELMAAERGLTVDTTGFKDLMENDRKISEAAEALRKGGGAKDLTMEAEQTAWLINRGIPTTDTEGKYDPSSVAHATVLALYRGRGGQTASAGFEETSLAAADESDVFGVVLDRSPFYYESGGQVYDTGVLVLDDGSSFDVHNVQSYAGYVVHVGSYAGAGAITVGAGVSPQVDLERRSLVAPNHTMTHVLNFALKSVLLRGVPEESAANLCDQKGSLVDAERLRFDFSWNGSLGAAQVAEVEALVCDRIQKALPVYAENVPIAAAMQINAVRCVFGERYPDPVRVISVGEPVADLVKDPANPAWKELSVEFCGGTHLTNTKQAEDFVIIEESGIAKGIRRISGLTRKGALAARQRAQVLIEKLQALAKLPGGPELNASSKALKNEIDQALVSLVDKEKMRVLQASISDTLKVWMKASEATRSAEAATTAESIATNALKHNLDVIFAEIDFGADGKIAKKIQEKFKAVHPTASSVIVSVDDSGERIGLFIAVSPNHEKDIGLSANKWCDHCVTGVGAGKGGGRSDFANASIPVQSAGPPIQVSSVLDAAKTYIHKKDILKY